MDLQIDDFYRDAASALLQLYRVFPRKVALYVEDLIGREQADPFGLPSLRHQSCLGTLLWLAEEGYLRYASCIGHEALDQAVLSEKGFLRLSRQVPPAAGADEGVPPSVRRVQGTLAYRLSQALEAGASECIARWARLLLEDGSPSRHT